MPDSIVNQHSFVRGAVRESDLSYVALVIDEFAARKTSHSILVQWTSGKFQRIAGVQWSMVGLDILRRPHPGVVALGEFGQVVIAGPGVLREERINIVGSEVDRIVPLRAVKVVGASAYAVGMRRQAYARDESGAWRAIHGNMLSAIDSRTAFGLEAVDGFTEQEIYAAGWEGELWSYDGGQWNQIVSPTNLIFTAICCASNGFTYACGQAGLLIKGRHNSWQTIDTAGVGTDFWGLACLHDRIFVTGSRQLFELRGDNLTEVKDATSLTNSFYSLSTNGQILWSIGPKAILSFDGKQWDKIV